MVGANGPARGRDNKPAIKAENERWPIQEDADDKRATGTSRTVPRGTGLDRIRTRRATSPLRIASRWTTKIPGEDHGASTMPWRVTCLAGSRIDPKSKLRKEWQYARYLTTVVLVGNQNLQRDFSPLVAFCFLPDY